MNDYRTICKYNLHILQTLFVYMDHAEKILNVYYIYIYIHMNHAGKDLACINKKINKYIYIYIYSDTQTYVTRSVFPCSITYIYIIYIYIHNIYIYIYIFKTSFSPVLAAMASGGPHSLDWERWSRLAEVARRLALLISRNRKALPM